MKLIYLDIDQVLNCYDDHERLHHSLSSSGLIPEDIYFYTKGDYVVKDKLDRLLEIVNHYGAQVVIVSSWATFKRDGENICRFLGVKYHSDAYNTGGGIERGRGVKQHALDHNLEETDYIIIDDADSMYEDQSRLIHIDGRKGITDDDVEYIKNFW